MPITVRSPVVQAAVVRIVAVVAGAGIAGRSGVADSDTSSQIFGDMHGPGSRKPTIRGAAQASGATWAAMWSSDPP